MDVYYPPAAHIGERKEERQPIGEKAGESKDANKTRKKKQHRKRIRRDDTMVVASNLLAVAGALSIASVTPAAGFVTPSATWSTAHGRSKAACTASSSSSAAAAAAATARTVMAADIFGGCSVGVFGRTTTSKRSFVKYFFYEHQPPTSNLRKDRSRGDFTAVDTLTLPQRPELLAHDQHTISKPHGFWLFFCSFAVVDAQRVMFCTFVQCVQG